MDFGAVSLSLKIGIEIIPLLMIESLSLFTLWGGLITSATARGLTLDVLEAISSLISGTLNDLPRMPLVESYDLSLDSSVISD